MALCKLLSSIGNSATIGTCNGYVSESPRLRTLAQQQIPFYLKILADY